MPLVKHSTYLIWFSSINRNSQMPTDRAAHVAFMLPGGAVIIWKSLQMLGVMLHS